MIKNKANNNNKLFKVKKYIYHCMVTGKNTVGR